MTDLFFIFEDYMKLKTKDIIHVGLFAALTSAGAFLSIPIGPVPITLQSMIVLMAGLILGSKKGFMSQLVYMLIGLIGVPVFAGGVGGASAILRPSFGFVFGFMAMAYVVGLMREHGFSALKSTIVGTLVLYLVGLPYMALILNVLGNSGFNFIQILNMGLIMFIPGDTLKIIAATWSAEIISKRVNLPLENSY